MARSTKTKHVLDLVGAEPVKKTVHPPKPATVEKADKPFPTVTPVGITTSAKYEAAEETVIAETGETVDAAAVHEKAPLQTEAEEQTAELQQADETPAETIVQPVQDKPKITAVVCELINQELLNVSERFNLRLTDSNLWGLTRAALQEVRPEFAVDKDDLNEKLERLRPRVIAAMAKAAIKLSAKGRNS